MQVAILQLSKKDRRVAIDLDPQYHHYFCRLSKDRRRIFLDPQEAFKTFKVLSQESSSIWEKIISISSYIEFKKYINTVFEQVREYVWIPHWAKFIPVPLPPKKSRPKKIMNIEFDVTPPNSDDGILSFLRRPLN